MRLIPALMLAIATALGAADDGRHAAALRAYAVGDNAAALETWQALAQERGADAALLAAMGNAEWRLGRKGRAMVCWERALLMDPRQPAARAGIAHASAVGGVDRPSDRWHERYAGLMEADAWLALALAAAWAWLLAWALPRWRGRRMGDGHHRVALAAATALALVAPALWGSWQLHHRAVNRIPDEPLKLTPTALGEPLLMMGEGDVARMGRTLNGHARVELAGGQVGWVRLAALEPVAEEGPPRSLDGGAP
jgi:tetratricopeptide (TPR) repeat protein